MAEFTDVAAGGGGWRQVALARLGAPGLPSIYTVQTRIEDEPIKHRSGKLACSQGAAGTAAKLGGTVHSTREGGADRIGSRSKFETVRPAGSCREPQKSKGRDGMDGRVCINVQSFLSMCS